MLNKQSLTSLLSPWIEQSHNRDILQSITVTNLELDSRKITPGDTFVAVIGHATDGRNFISQAVKNGANAVIAQACSEHQHGTVTTVSECVVIYVAALDNRLSELSGRLYSSSAQLIGVTGTNGKTTITQLIAQWIELLGKRAAVMGTTGNGFLDNLTVAANTTGSAVDIHKTVAGLSAQGADFVALEVSSHGLVQGRVKTLPFAVGVFSNLSRDHLDYHGTMQEYAKAKLSLFTEHDCKAVVMNADDKTGRQWLGKWNDAVAVSIECQPECRCSLWANRVSYSDSGISMSIDGYWGKGELTVPLIGAFNASNVLLSLATLLTLGFDKSVLLACAQQLQPVVGRMELFQNNPAQAKVVVDYAHTPDALEQALSALRVHCSGQLWVIFGCGGDRDSGKRPMMAEIAERLADKVILTDDNPRNEDPQRIFQDMLAGMTQPQLALTEHDRYQALKTAYHNASAQDIILLAGKGHEDYQVFQDQTVHYSDRESAMKILELSECRE